jgi:thiol:disulfide interchange protein DsbD
VEATWSLPPGYEVSALEHPVPKKLASDEATTYVYDTEVTLLATITPPKGAAKMLRVGVTLDWLVCRERCVPGGDSVSAVIGSIPSAALSEGAAAIARARAALPRLLASAAIGIGVPARRSRGDSLIITVPLTGAGADTVTDFFPEGDEALALNHAAVRVAHGRIVLPYLIADRHARITELRGLLIRNGVGYAARIPL